MGVPEDHARSPFAHQRTIEAPMACSMLEQHAGDVESLSGRLVELTRGELNHLASERLAQLLGAAHEQVILVMEMRVERRSADVGTVEHVLHGNPVIALLDRQLEQ